MASVPFNNLITFSRGSNATLTGPTGLIQWAPSNLLLNSEQFDNANWNKFNATINANVTAAPDGTATADALVENTTAGNHIAQQFVSYTSGLSYTFSFYVKAGTRSWARISMPSAAFGTEASSFYNLSGDGSLGVVSGPVTARTITAAGNGWYRITISATATATAGGNTIVFSASADNTSFYAGVNGAEALYLWGAQLELGSTATTYNSTTVKNLLGFSEAFDNAAWTKVNASIVTGAQANPVNGAFNAQKFMEDTVNTAHEARQLVAVNAAPHTYSVYLKAGGRSFAMLFVNTLNVGTVFDLSNGATAGNAGFTAPTAASITSVGNGWYRCSITVTTTAASLSFRVYIMQNATTYSYTGDGNSGVYIYGAQLSDSASLDPYVPTPAAAPSSTAFYGPRFDYDPVTLAAKGILVEEARTNLALYSQEIGGTNWLPDDITVALNSIAAPNGTLTASTLTDTATNSDHRVISSGTSPSFTAGTSYTLSVYVKNNTRNFMQIAFATAPFSATAYANFDVATGVLGTVGSGTTASITAVGSGWYRCSITVTATTTASAAVFFALITSATATRSELYAGIGSSLYVWGAQLETGAFATSYIPTVASTVTRAADVATISGSLFSQWYGQSEGTFVVEATVPTDVDGGSGNFYLAASDGTIANQIILADVSGTVGQIQTGGVLQFNNGVGAEPTGVLKAAIAFQTNNTIICAGGTLGTLDTSVTLPTVNRLLIGIRGDSNSTTLLNGHIRSLNFIPARAADFQLQALTS
jgi:hypothetical protein